MLRPSYNLRNTSAPVPVRRKLVSPRQTFVMAPPHALPATGAGYGDRAVLTGISWVFTLFLLVRLVLTDPVMNGFINYSDEGGSLIEKIHPATYGIIGLLVLTLFRVQVTLSIAEFRLIKTMLGLIGVIFGLTIFLTMIGRSVSMGYLLETYIGACLAAILLVLLPQEKRQMIGEVLVVFVMVNALLAIAEKAAGARLLPYPYEELSFRPTALTSHPLSIGLLHAGTVVFVLATRWRALFKAGAIGLIVLGTFAAGARTGSIFTGAAAIIALMVTTMPGASAESRFRLKALLLGSLLLIGPLLLLGANEAGFLERFHGGYFDENAQARVDVYQVFDWVTTNEILFGSDLLAIKKMVFERLGILVESSVVVFVFQFGLFGAVLFMAAIFWVFYRLAAAGDRRAFIGSVAFLAVALSNDAMSGKHPILMVMFLMLIAFRRGGVDAFGRPISLKWGEKS